MQENISEASIEDRLSTLERSVYGNSSPDFENKYVDSLMNIHNRLQSAVTGREKITSLFSKLDDLEKYLNPMFRENMSLSDPAKLNLVLLEEDRIRKAVDSLQTVKDLVQYLDSEHVKAVPSLCPKLYAVSEVQVKLQEDVGQLSQETSDLIAKYDQLMLTFSKQFILWDSILTDIEKERMKAKSLK
ncbi:dynactin subunit 3-like [Uloborus diversus]|uniref:dynactin subunit 3-like n=1 Tax=Uloborus diversus TaxID=327109 RepID=UPI0024098894|nr:dynactin subunit 3-like [Uloborus diversus]